MPRILGVASGYYSLTLNPDNTQFTAQMFCSDQTCSHCRFNSNNQNFGLCQAVSVNSESKSMFVHSIADTCTGGVSPSPVPAGYVLAVYDAPVCVFAQSAAMSFLSDTSGNCVGNPFWHNITHLENGNLDVTTNCSNYCSSCAFKFRNITLSQCLPGPNLTSFRVISTQSLKNCAVFPAGPTTTSIYILIGASFGGIALIVVAAMVIRRRYFSQPKIVYIRIPSKAPSMDEDM